MRRSAASRPASGPRPGEASTMISIPESAYGPSGFPEMNNSCGSSGAERGELALPQRLAVDDHARFVPAHAGRLSACEEHGGKGRRGEVSTTDTKDTKGSAGESASRLYPAPFRAFRVFRGLAKLSPCQTPRPFASSTSSFRPATISSAITASRRVGTR